MNRPEYCIEETTVRTLLFSLAALFLPFSASAEWTAQLPDSAPSHFFAVDKEKDMLYRVSDVQGKKSLIKSFPAIHGSVEGDKQVQGDLKTPEGIYFITKKIAKKLDFMDYGPLAFGLNYPNAADHIMGKTGGGIWLHSKGRPIKEVKTRGCVAIEQADIEELVPVLKPGTPVMIAQRIEEMLFEEKKNEKTGEELRSDKEKKDTKGSAPSPEQIKEEKRSAESSMQEKKVISLSEEWKKRFSEASGDLFELYDRTRWNKANRERFSVVEKKRTGEMDGKKDPDEGEVRVLSGPGYWTAFFDRKIRRGKEERSGIQVLYWMPDETGEFRVIGDIWVECR